MLAITTIYHCILGITTLFLIFYCKAPFFKTKVLCGAFAGLFFAMIYAAVLDLTAVYCEIPTSDPDKFRIAPLFSLLRLFVQGTFIEGSLFFLGCGLRVLLTPKRTWYLNITRSSFLFLFVVLLTFIGIDSILIEPTALQVQKIQFYSDKIHKAVRIVLITDPQLDNVGQYEKKVLETVKEQNGDIILFGGDYIQFSRSSVEKEGSWLVAYERKKKYGRAKNLYHEYNSLLKEINLQPSLRGIAILGTYCEMELEKSIFNDTSIEIQTKQNTINISDDIILTCLTPTECLKPTHQEFLNKTQREKGQYHIIIGHMPDYVMGMPDADLLLAGHTHGGQIRIPFWGPITINSRHLPKKWGSGHTKIKVPQEDREIDLIVSNGTGMERGLAPRVRFCCRPDIWVIDLLPR